MSERNSESASEGGSGSHPLVGLLFWMMGKNLEEEVKETKNLTQQEEEIASSERIQRRSLSWKDEHPNELLETWHEFVDVKGPDIALTDSTDPDKSSLKAGTMLSRKPSTLGDEDDEEDKKRYSPNSPNWGFFVAITPPTDLYPSNQSNSTTSKSSTPSVSTEVTPKAQQGSIGTFNANKAFAAATAVTAATEPQEKQVEAPTPDSDNVTDKEIASEA
jgi:hypothetical protein